jgi:hypothetical protein
VHSRPKALGEFIATVEGFVLQALSSQTRFGGAPRIHGELLKLGIDVGQTTVAKYMASRRQPPSQGWRTFLRNHADGIASMDFLVVPTISFRLLYRFLILQHSRRQLLWLTVTARPSAHWIARQLTEAYGWQQTPRYIVRDRDCVYGDMVIKRLRATSVRSDGIVLTMLLCSANGISVICSILTKNTTTRLVRTYRCTKDAPIPRTIQTVGRTLAMPVLGGLHHQYFRA